MKDAIGMILGRHWWWRDSGGWHREPLAAGDGGAGMERFAALAADAGCGSFRLIFEPEGLAHQTVEMPRVGRAAFATLERVRRDFPVVASEALGWGIEPPVVGSTGTFSTLLHFELTPNLVRWLDRPGGPALRAAWSAFTVAAGVGDSGAEGDRPHSLLFILPDFVALAQWGGAKRAFKAWTGALTERDWKAVGFMLGEFEDSAGNRPELAGRRGPVSVVSHDDSVQACPFWELLRGSGRVNRELTLDDLASHAGRLPVRHPANLAAAFPRPLGLDRALAAVTLAAATVVVVMVLATLTEQRGLQQRLPSERLQVEDLERTLSSLRANEAEMKALEAEMSGVAKLPPLDRAASLRNLAAVFPDAATLTRLQMGPEDRFELSALVGDAGFDAATFPALLAGAGFASTPKAGMAFDAGKGTLEVRGQIGGGR